jgi:transposase
MPIRDARSISAKELSDRRRQAVALFEAGRKRKDIAPIVGAHRNVVGRWVRAWQEQGEASFAVKPAGRPVGRGCRLSGWQASLIKRLITDKTPDQLKFPFALWTREAVRMLIAERFDIELPIRTVGNYLKRWGFTPQRPVRRAYERNNAAIRRWLTEEYPAIAQRAKRESAEIHWGDETGLRSDDVTGRSYSPQGQTPVVRRKGRRERLSMVSAITNRGKLRFCIFKGAVNARLMRKFLARLVRDTNRKVFLILDNLKVHHSKPVTDWLEAHKDRIEVFFLPRYSPELNPDEYLNSDFKQQVRKRPDSRKQGTLAKHARSVMHSIQKRPKRVISYFHVDHTKYAS